MKYSALNTRNPNCDLQLFRKYQSLYEGGKLFKENIREFLTPNQMDPPDVYQLRIKEASYRSYIGPIVDSFASHLFSAPYAIRTDRDFKSVGDEFYSQFKEDVDLCGTDLTSFIKSKFIESLVKGTSYWLAESPDDGGEKALDRQEWLDRGLDRIKLCAIPTDCVLDWECDDYGDYVWINLHYKEVKRVSPDQNRDLITETWKIFNQETVDVYRIIYSKKNPPKPEDIIPKVESYQHGFNKVPLVKLCLPEGLWLLNRAADAQIEHFRLSTALGWSLRKAAYAIGIFKLKENSPIVNGAGQGIIIGIDEDFSFAEPKGTSFSILQNEIKNQKDEIYRIAVQMAQSVDNNSAALGRSGESKNADNASTEIILHAYADIVKEAIEKTFELISDARGDVDLHFSIEGMNKFHLQDAQILVDTAKTAKELAINSPTLYQELNYRVAESLLPWDTSQEVKDKIREEIFTAPAIAPQLAEAKPADSEIDKMSKDETADV